MIARMSRWIACTLGWLNRGPRRCDPRAHVGIGVRQAGRLGHPVRHVDAEAVHAAFQPEPQRLLEVVENLRVVPVQIGLLGVEEVQVPLARLPSGSSTRVQAGPPNTDSQLLGGNGRRLRAVAKEIAIPGGAARPGGQRRLKPWGAASWCGWAPRPS